MIENIYLLFVLLLSYHSLWALFILVLNNVFLFRPIEFITIISLFNFIIGMSENILMTWVLSSVVYLSSIYFYSKNYSTLPIFFKELPLEMLSYGRYSFHSNNILVPWLFSLLSSFISIPLVVISVFWYPLFTNETRCKNKKMIVFIHSDHSNINQWAIVRLALTFSGFNDHYDINILNKTHSHEHTSLLICSDIAKSKIELLMSDNVEELILVGHSLGGLVAAHLAENGLKGKVKRVIAISSPFNGSHLIDIANNFGVMNTGMYKEYISGAQKELLKQMYNSSVEYLFIACENDILVRPQSAIPKTTSERDNMVILPNVGHYNVKLIPDTLNILLNWL